MALTPSATTWPWTGADVGDPREWVLRRRDPAARWLLLTGCLGRGPDDPDVRAAREQVLTAPDTADLLARLPDWEGGAGFSGHNSPAFAPNILNLLADMGLRAGDDARVEGLLDRMLDHQDADGRFQSFAPLRGADQPVWGALLCDTHAITEVLVRFGRGDDPRVRVALDRMAADLTVTTQGPPGRADRTRPPVSMARADAGTCARRCRSRGCGPSPGFRSPCAHPQLAEVARVVLSAWGDRAESVPYMFGHGRSFKAGKWPATWYSALTVLDALAGYPELWRGPGADPVDRRSVTELVACLIAYTMDAHGRVRPQSTFRGFEDFSFGQKKQASPFATAKVLSVLARFSELAEDVAVVDVLTLTSSKGGSGTVVAPRTR